MQHSLDVIIDVVKRYDIDGVHFDDYFYPYPINDKDGKRVDFPDETSWQKYVAGLNGKKPLARDDWRRQNVDQFLERLSAAIHAEKPWVKFGVSPFGIYRPGQPEGIQGFDAYANLYADSLKWFRDQFGVAGIPGVSGTSAGAIAPPRMFAFTLTRNF